MPGDVWAHWNGMNRSVFREYRVGFGGGGITYYVQWLMFANIAVFVLQLMAHIPLGGASHAPPGGRLLVEGVAYSNAKLFDGWIWVPFTYMFVHGSLSHLFFNMLQLYFFGPEVERTLGTRQFLRFYLVCGVLAALANLLVLALGGGGGVVIGASGAVLGVLVAFAVIDPDREILLFPIPFPINARALVLLLLLLNVINGLEGGTDTAVATHLGGMAAGYVYMKLRPLTLQWSWQRRGRSVRKPKPDKGVGPDEAKVKEAVDNIFKFQGKDRR